MVSLIAGSEIDGAFNIYYDISTTSWTDSISVYRPGRARAGDVLSFYDVYCRLSTSVASFLNTSLRSPVSVLRSS